MGRLYRVTKPNQPFGMSITPDKFIMPFLRELMGGAERMNQQEFELKMEEKPTFLRVWTSGLRSRENVQFLSMKVFNTALEKHLSKVLLDIRDLVGYFGYLDIFFLVKDVLLDLRRKGVDQVAIIDIHRATREGWFLEPVAQGKGVNIRVFPDEESARKWLGE
jgi:hypothetical protein